jgi:hypothetical protein
MAMIDVLTAPDHVLAVRMSGTVDEDDYDRVIAEAERRLARHERIGVFFDLTDFDDVTPGAATKDIGYVFGKIGQWRRFPREAIVTDKRWIRALIKAAAPLVPQIEMRTFDPAEREAGLRWATEVPAS